jgi:DnaJ-domain-containing protein 1
MGGLELIAIVVFFLVGYWLVDFIWPKKKADAPAAAQLMAGDAGLAENAPWHEVLGVPPDAKPEQIRKAYEEMSARHHPALFAGTGPEFEQAAVRMTRRINDAYAEAVRARP